MIVFKKFKPTKIINHLKVFTLNAKSVFLHDKYVKLFYKNELFPLNHYYF